MGNRLGIDASGSIVRVTASLITDDPNFDIYEAALLSFLSTADVWTVPWLFDHPASSRKAGRVYCFILDSSQSHKFIPIGLSCINYLYKELNVAEPWVFKASITGSAAQSVVDLTRQVTIDSKTRGSRVAEVAFRRLSELACVVNSVDFLLHTIPNAMFHYEK